MLGRNFAFRPGMTDKKYLVRAFAVAFLLWGSVAAVMIVASLAR